MLFNDLHFQRDKTFLNPGTESTTELVGVLLMVTLRNKKSGRVYVFSFTEFYLTGLQELD